MLLGRWLGRTTRGFTFKHSEQLIQSILELSGVSKAKAATLPGTPSDGKKEGETPATKEEQEIYRTIVGKLLFMQNDRPDLQYAIGELSRGMKEPTIEDRARMKKVCRYLVGTQFAVQAVEPTGDFLCGACSISARSDSDWAKDALGRKSVSGGAVYVAGACVVSFCRRQACIALSSAEAELYAMTATLIEARGIQQFLGELKVTGTIEAEVDSSAALAIASRLGPGKLKHVDIRQLWVQQEVAAGRVLVKKVATSLNCADILTKILKEVAAFRRHCATLGLRFQANGSNDTTGDDEVEDSNEAAGHGSGGWIRSLLGLVTNPGH